MKTALIQLLERIEATINNDPANDFGNGQVLKFDTFKINEQNLK